VSCLGKLYSQERIRKYDIFEKVIRLDTSFQNPYSDTKLKTVFTEPTKTEHFAEGFYDGDNTWKIRFAPGNYKTWNYRYQFSHLDSVSKGSFFCLWISGIDPLGINQVNPNWFRKTVYPFLAKGTVIAWNKLLENDTLYFKDLAKNGFNLFYLENATDKKITLFPLDYREYRKIEPSVSWLWKNNIAVLMPVTVFQENERPKNSVAWDHYLSYFFARLGVFSNLMFYVPENVGAFTFNEKEKEQIAAAILENDPYHHPVSMAGKANHALVNQNYRFDLLTGQTSNPDQDKTICPKLMVVPREAYSKPETLLRFVCTKFFESTQCIVDQNLITSEDLVRQISGLYSVIESLPYYEMKRLDDISASGNLIGIKNKEYLLLSENKSKVSLNLGTQFYKATWIDPTKQEKEVDAGVISGKVDLSAPSGGKIWLLHLSHQNSGYPQGIHLSWTKQPESSLTITWSTASGNNDCTVKYREKGTEKWLSKNGQSEKSPGDNWIHSVVIDNLKPSGIYEYMVSADRNLGEVYSEVFETATTPSGNNSSFTFSFITDTGLDGRLDNNATGSLRVLNEILFEKPDFLLGGGDYAYANRDKRFKSTNEAINRWFDQNQPLLAKIPMMAQYGNHELYLDERFEDWAPYFKHPDGFRNNKHYSFDIGNVHFTSFCLVDFLPDQEELAWLDNDLAQARKRNQWIVVFHHEPIFAYGTSHPSKPEISKVIYPIFRKHKVDLSICSHDQNYERTFPLSGLNAENPDYSQRLNTIYKKGDGTVFLKVSPCGKKSEIGNTFPLFQDKQPPFIAVRDRSAHHFAMFSMVDGKSMEVKVYNVPEDSEAKYLIDRFIISKHD
jgi:hypothetical protein